MVDHRTFPQVVRGLVEEQRRAGPPVDIREKTAREVEAAAHARRRLPAVGPIPGTGDAGALLCSADVRQRHETVTSPPPNLLDSDSNFVQTFKHSRVDHPEPCMKRPHAVDTWHERRG